MAHAPRRPVAPSVPLRGIQPASDGVGPLFQRDYWAVLDRGVAGPEDAAEAMASRFWAFAPPGLVRFARRDGRERPLQPGDELDVEIRLAGTWGVRVTHRDAMSLTLVTLEAHPEAGRITFGAYPNAADEVVVHIRSRARAGSRGRYLGFLATGEPMQTLTWSDFIQRLAHDLDEGIRDVIHAETRKVEATPEDGPDGIARPTFRAVGR